GPMKLSEPIYTGRHSMAAGLKEPDHDIVHLLKIKSLNFQIKHLTSCSSSRKDVTRANITLTESLPVCHMTSNWNFSGPFQLSSALRSCAQGMPWNTIICHRTSYLRPWRQN